MTDFAETRRQRCRECHIKLPSTTANDHHAFCCKGCHASFYRQRCAVCEAGQVRRRVCHRLKCRSAYRGNRSNFAFPGQGSGSVKERARNADGMGIKSATNGGRWSVIAAPQLTPRQFHCATVPDGADRKWSDGKLERIEKQNRRSLEAHFDALDRAAVESDFCNVCGREDDLSDYRTAAGWATTCHGCRAASAAKENPAVKALIATIPDDLPIPKFLQRTTNTRAAA